MIGIVAVLVVAGVVVEAHHSVAGEYDQNREATIDGVITEFRFVNPHPVITVSESDSGQVWRFDLDNLLEFDAIGFSAGDLKVGDRIIVLGWLARREANRLYTMRLERPADGFGFEQIANHPQLLAPR
jgi:hypothetical protein